VTTTTTDPAVLVGLETPDDAAVYRLSDDVALVQTVDFFTPIVDDPYDWGRVAAANALSDVYAMGGTPITALNLVGWPRALGFELLGRVLDGGSDACAEAGVAIVGGHSVDDPEPKYGLAVTGTVHPDQIVRKAGAPAGCDLVLTKPLGTGIISSAIKEGKASEPTTRAAVATMTELNRAASEAMVHAGAAAATDVTGFGLIGHLLGMLDEDVSAVLDFDAIPLLPDVVELARDGVYAGGSQRNLDSMRGLVDTGDLDDARARVLFDAQTSGGLLIAVDPGRTEELLDDLRSNGVREAVEIGELVNGDGTVKVLRG
jgi:selenide,water dikinase